MIAAIVKVNFHFKFHLFLNPLIFSISFDRLTIYVYIYFLYWYEAVFNFLNGNRHLVFLFQFFLIHLFKFIVMFFLIPCRNWNHCMYSNLHFKLFIFSIFSIRYLRLIYLLELLFIFSSELFIPLFNLHFFYFFSFYYLHLISMKIPNFNPQWLSNFYFFLKFDLLIFTYSTQLVFINFQYFF